MKTLSKMLKENNNIEKIKKLAIKFGFIDIKIYAAPDEDTLQFMAIDDPEKEDGYTSALEAKLIQLLQCQVAVLVDSNYIDFKTALLNNCANLEDENEILRLFGKSYEEITFRDPDQDIQAQHKYKSGLYLADTMLKDTSGNESAFFYPDKQASNTTKSPDEKKEHSPPQTQRQNYQSSAISPTNKGNK